MRNGNCCFNRWCAANTRQRKLSSGWGNPGTRGEQSAPNVTIYNQLPSGDIAKAGEPSPNKSALKTKTPSKGGAY